MASDAVDHKRKHRILLRENKRQQDNCCARTIEVSDLLSGKQRTAPEEVTLEQRLCIKDGK